MAISQVATTSGGGATVTTLTPTLPTNIADDVLYLFIGAKSADTTFTTPSGWTALTGSPFGSAGEGKAWAFRKVSSGSESNPSSTRGGTNDKFRWICVSLRGVDTTTPEVDTDWTETTDYSSSPVIPTSAAGGATCWSIVFLACLRDNSESPSWPSGWTQQVEEHAGAFTNRHYYASNTSPGTSSIGGGTITLVTEDGQEKVLQVLVRESGGGGATGQPYTKRTGGVPGMATGPGNKMFGGSGQVWRPIMRNKIIGPSMPIRRAA